MGGGDALTGRGTVPIWPFIYHTNGYDLWFWNDAANEPPRRVYGFHSKDCLQYLRFQLTEREPRAQVAPALGIIDRLYQHEVVKKVVERFAEKKRKALLVKRVFNKDTNRLILRNLMERGIKDATGSRVGKTIIFARNHNHAVLLQNPFEEMYPQYSDNFCRVIDNYDPRAEELIDDFKGQGSNPELTIAISVDMLDTGIDVPEVVNLVFAKPVYSLRS
jgi:type I site-specific restriction endonuclease